MNKQIVEAEGSELILKNKSGDHVIIPKKYRQEVLDMIKENCHSCIDALVETLPIAQDYAQDGTVIINPDDKPVIKKSKVRIENKKVYDQFSEDEIRQFIEEDTRDTSETLKAQARYRHYSNLIEQGRFRNDSTYQSFKQNLPSKISDRMRVASIFAKNNPDFYEPDSTVRQRLSQEEYDDYIQTKQILESARETSTQGTDVFSGAHGARSIALDIEPRKGIVKYVGKEVEENKQRSAAYRLDYNPTTKDYEYVLVDATKGKKYKGKIKAEQGLVLPKDKITFEYPPYAIEQDNTYMKSNVNLQLEKKKKPYTISREPYLFKADTRTEQERKVAQEYTESILNPSLITQIGESLQKPLRWLADPIKGIGDIIEGVAPKSALAKDLPNTNEDTFEYRKKQLSPYISSKKKISNTINEALPLTNWALLNTLPVEAAAGNMIKSGKNLIKGTNLVENATKAGNKVLNKTDDVVKLVERKRVFDEETLGAIERYNKYFGKNDPNSTLTMRDKIRIGRDIVSRGDLNKAYRNTHIDEVINAKKQGYFNNNRFPDTDWYYGGSASKYGNIEIETIADSKYFRLFEVDGKYVGSITPDKDILHLKGVNVPFKGTTIRYKGEVLTDDILEEISKRYKKGDDLGNLISIIKNKKQ